MTELLDQFKESLKDDYNPSIHDDFYLNRFLVARNNNVEKATIMFKSCLDWRKNEKVEELAEHFVFSEMETVREIWPRFYHKVDRQGRPVLINRHYNLDANKLYACTTDERLLKAHIREQEKLMDYRLPACSAAKGERVGQLLLILDSENYPFMQFHRISGLIQKITRISSDYYPETLGKIIIINAPWFFAKVWKIVEKFFDAGTREKISIFGTNYHADLQKEISPENLPEFFGGLCKCETAGGCELSDAGPWKNEVVGKFNFALRDSAVTLDPTPAIRV